jgi:cell division septal protein FtsQ
MKTSTKKPITRRRRVTVKRSGRIPTVTPRFFHLLAKAGMFFAAFLLALSVTIGTLEIIRYVRTTDYLAVRYISVIGYNRASAEEIIGLAGIHEGDNLVAVDIDAAALRVARHPWIAECRITRELPDRIYISVSEHIPAAIALLEAPYLTNIEGRPLKRFAPGDPADLPLITGVSRADFDGEPAAAAWRIKCGIQLARKLTELELWERLNPSEINVDASGSLTLFLDGGGTKVILGASADEEKLETLRAVVEEFEQRGEKAAYIYLNQGKRRDRVAVKPAVPLSQEPPSPSGNKKSSNPSAPERMHLRLEKGGNIHDQEG